MKRNLYFKKKYPNIIIQLQLLKPYLKYLSLLWLLLFVNILQPQAQGAYFWSEQERIPNYVDTASEPPYLVADMNHTVHAFNSQPLDLADPSSYMAVFYRQWTLENGWTEPNDILVDPDGEGIGIVGMTSDNQGRVFLILQKGGDLYYSQNYLANAKLAATWPTPTYIAGQSERSRPGVVNVAAIAVSPDGNEIVVIYGGLQNGSGLYFTHSSDGGNIWTEPYPVFLTGDETVVVADPKIIFSESGLFHVVWTSFQKSGAGGDGYYANFDPATELWSDPMPLDATGIRTPSIIEAQGHLFIGYHHANANGNWWRQSSDGGVTWTLAEQISPQHKGTNGAVSFVIDGENILHVFFGERINDANHGMWHMTYTGATWANLEPVVRGPQIRDVVGGNGFDPRSARAVIVNGNVALVTWATDGAGGTNGAWYSYKRLSAPELPTVLLEAPTVMPLSIPNVTVTPTITITATAETSEINKLDIKADPPSFGSNPQTSIILGVVPVLVLLLGVILIHHIRQNKNT